MRTRRHCLTIQLLPYAAVVLAIPLAPFLLPLLVFPLVLLIGLLIVGDRKVVWDVQLHIGFPPCK